eukprot:CAMPEP_0118923230 /NCGR_PEP_ID=MMETSP1169-20130426/1836_1 /TAXON_ID=36882 /ORGANISM="Pyramimonas obovata, Strain CCMP722" /LENGTH=311 /DNA_ID=CAMNT_0006864193 /DNA_START=348 /DNA_END=1283 /DNA_ORIENTATION=-
MPPPPEPFLCAALRLPIHHGAAPPAAAGSVVRSQGLAGVSALEVDLVDGLEGGLAERDVRGEGVDVLLQLLQCRRTDDGARHVPAGAAPGEGEGGEGHAGVVRDLLVLADGGGAGLGLVPHHEPRVHREPRLLRLLPAQILAAQRAAAQGAPGQQADVVVAGGASLRQVVFERAVQQREGVLDGDGPRHAQLVRNAAELAHAEGGLIAQAIVLDLAVVHELLQREQRFLDRNCVPLLGGVISGCPESCDVSVGPVKLVKVDVIGLEPTSDALHAAKIDSASSLPSAGGPGGTVLLPTVSLFGLNPDTLEAM